jgi:hypothetical protein
MLTGTLSLVNSDCFLTGMTKWRPTIVMSFLPVTQENI